ncbi:hypothetical protein ABT369_21140 [Dactylosporangium sp. NPDC000244]|uniref:hypothetical protein n=1 Tax=Dactylosporangium sp. NPDC000244 TaxID=3154365 RepID=UPI003324DDF3
MIRRWGWLLAGVAGGALTLLLMVVMPPDRTIDNPAEFVLRLAPVVFAVLAIGGFPQRPGIGLALLAMIVVGYMGVVDTLYTLRVLGLADATDQSAAFPSFYQMAIFVNAFTILAVLFGYRLGGAPSGRVLRLGFAATLVLVSGLNDITFFYLYDWPEGRPERFTWASHITVFTGSPASPAGAIAFCAVHLVLAGLVLALPWLRTRLHPRLPSRPESAASAPR